MNDQMGCYYCMSIINVGDITEFCDNGQTPICPECGVDSLTDDINKLAELHKAKFGVKGV